MASNRRTDWIRARDEYLDPLDERFPNNPYKEQTQKWRDRILVVEAEGQNRNAARQFVSHHTAAADASARGDDLAAVRQFRELTGLLEPKSNDPRDRKWYLLALKRTEALEKMIRDRRQFVEKELQIADEALRSGRRAEAIVIREKLVEQYGKFTDLADLLTAAPHPTPASPGRSP
jgi:hypothetical protein